MFSYAPNLNTSHVKVKGTNVKNQNSMQSNLNTSHVKVKEMLKLMKQISLII